MTTDLGPIESFPVGEPRSCDVDGRRVVVVNVGDEVLALDDVCSHEEFPLSDGFVDVEECEIECARHGAMFSLRTGEALSLPATRPVAVVAVRIDNGRLVAP